MQKDRRVLDIVSNHPHMRPCHTTQPFRSRLCAIGDRAHRRVKPLRRPADDRPEHVFLGGDMGIEAAALHVEGARDVSHARRAVAALAEERARHILDLPLPTVHVSSIANKRLLVSHSYSVMMSFPCQYCAESRNLRIPLGFYPARADRGCHVIAVLLC